MSSGALQRLSEKKGKQLSKFLGIDSVPSTQLITNMQSRIKNTIFKLSIEDYEAMCGNKIMVRMMSKVIGCEEKQLKKFCKYINVFKDNINSSSMGTEPPTKPVLPPWGTTPIFRSFKYFKQFV